MSEWVTREREVEKFVWSKKYYKIEFLIIINQSTVMLKHSSNLSVCRVASDQHHIENWLVMYTLRSSFFFLAIWVGYACNQQEDTYGHIHPYINTSNTLHGWSESKKVTFKQRTNETSIKKIMVHKLRSDGSEWEGSESEHTREKKRRARDEMERERWSMSSPMEHWKLINLFNVIRSTWPKVCTVMYPLFCSCYLLFFLWLGLFCCLFYGCACRRFYV